MIDDDTLVTGLSADDSAALAQPENLEAQDQRQRDPETGKFVGQKPGEEQSDEGAQAEAQKNKDKGKRPAEKAPEGYVAKGAFDAERQKRKQLEREFRELRGFVQGTQTQRQQPSAPQKPEPLPDWFADPDPAYKARFDRDTAPLREEIKALRDQMEGQGAAPRQVLESTSRMIAMDRFGAEAVNAAYQAADEAMNANPATRAALKARFDASEHPFGELVKWHKEQAALSRVGDDPDAFIESEVEKRVAEKMAELAAAQPTGLPSKDAPPPGARPTNFANARNAGPRTPPAWSGPKPLSELYGR